ncbi:unnamed protein product [Bursaphelenchus xylophilus]|uniref:(pine wood nematode) hypothetical protein n=1 Tax=Bursaphelenchus xylophilus TaxID=6326 RepID=A0A7I8WJZ7_BURXY|nr:unnamed protein product [Bursaphelenchus xylophilus]CAG9107505.1 unnamed protein product [Bursaphelenchus xylophilus]
MATPIVSKYNQMIGESRPCYYEWGPWSPCTGTCRPHGQDPPIRVRKIIAGLTIMPRGLFRTKNLLNHCRSIANYTDSAPCNVAECPVSLRSFPFGKCVGKKRFRLIPRISQHINLGEDQFYMACD